MAWAKEHNVPCLVGASGWLVCDVQKLADGGDHEIVIGMVRAAEPIAGAPLVYHNRQFGTHSCFVGPKAPGSA